MSRNTSLKTFAAVSTAAMVLVAAPAALAAAAAPAAAAARPTSKAAQPWDLTGNWVSIVNEDWRWRMVTPPKGDYASVPLTPAGRAAADTWTPAMDGSCKAYGVAGVMRMPTRLKIAWAGDDQLRIETDAGVQTRMLDFAPARTAAPGARTLQGVSTAEWQFPAPAGGGAPRPPGGVLKVTTANHTAGWLRKNGVPYSENAQVVEYYDRWADPTGAEWFSVTTAVTDPVNLNQTFYTSSHFRRETDESKWRPKPCTPAAD